MRSAFVFAMTALAVAAEPRTLTLSEALEQASKLNPDVQVARLRVLETEADASRTSAARQPQVGAIVAASYNTSSLQGIGVSVPGLSSRLGPYGLINARPAFTQTIVDAGLVSAIRAARERVTESRESAEALRETILFAVTQLYVDALRAEARAMAAERRIGIASAVLKQTSDRHAEGAASKLDLARAEQQAESERVVAKSARRDAATLRSMLARVIGLDSGEDFSLQPPSSRMAEVPNQETVESEAVSNRAELKALAARSRAASEDRAQAARQRWPKVSAFGDFGFLGENPARGVSTYSVGAALTLPLWTGGRIKAEVAGASARLSQAQEEERKTRLQTKQEVRQALIEIEAARESEGVAKRAVKAARETLELARLRFSEGISTNLEATLAQRALADAEEADIRVRFELLNGWARLARARGDVASLLR